MRESPYQGKIIKKIRNMFPGCIILKNDSSYLQGVPDFLILYGPYWATLEFKARTKAGRQPNQEYYVNLMDDMSFSAFIYPENEEEVLDDLQQAFGHRRPSLASKSK